MKPKTLHLAATLLVLVYALSAQAHDPKEHMKQAEKPNCAAMKDMDHSKMDRDDPVTKAMMKQCMTDMQHDQAGEDESHSESKNTALSSEHPH